jgi:hypothetical protein
LNRFCFINLLILVQIVLSSPWLTHKAVYTIKPFITANDSFIVFVGQTAHSMKQDSLWIEIQNTTNQRSLKKNFDEVMFNLIYTYKNFNLVVADDGYIIAYDNGIVTKLNKKFNIIWKIKINENQDGSNEYSPGNCLLRLSDGYLVGNSVSADNNDFILLCRIDNAGNIIWKQEYRSSRLNLLDMIIINENNIFLLAYKGYNGWIDKIQEIRDFKNLRRSGAEIDENLNPLNYKYGSWTDIRILKIDSDGKESLSKTIGTTKWEAPTSLVSFKNEIFISYKVDQTSDSSAYAGIIKLDFEGNVVQEKKFKNQYNDINNLTADCNGIWCLANEEYLIKYDDNFNELKKINFKKIFDDNKIHSNYGEYGLKFIGNDKLLCYKLDEDEKIILKLIDLSDL